MKDILIKLFKNVDGSDYEELNKYVNFLRQYQEEIELYLSKIEKNKLYNKSLIHGIYHSEKVLFYSLILGYQLGLDKTDMQILMDGAVYHDCGRMNDYEDNTHGLYSAGRIRNEKIVSSNHLYDNETNLRILEFIVDAHSVDDKRIPILLINHDIPDEEFERATKLAKILKDADALDRKRFKDISSASLNEAFLRFSESKKLIGLAEEINSYYLDEIHAYNELNINDMSELSEEKACYHSIGFDFFRIKSILENGILSESAMKKRGLCYPRNFSGGNGYKWISVVDLSTKDNSLSTHSAFNEFIKNGISFYCFSKLRIGEPSSSMMHAYENDLPYNKGKYSDEKYVYDMIPPEKIETIIIPEQMGEMNIRKLNYIYNSLDGTEFINRIRYYFNATCQKGSMEDNRTLMNKINDYIEAVQLYNNLEGVEKKIVQEKLPVILEKKRELINEHIADWIYKYYSEILGKRTISVLDVVAYELKPYINNTTYTAISDNSYIAIELNLNQKNNEKDIETQRTTK